MARCDMNNIEIYIRIHTETHTYIILSGFGNIPNFVPILFSYLCDLIPSQTGIATL